MVIPKGKKFRFKGLDAAFSSDSDESFLASKSSEIISQGLGIQVPRYGYLGNAYLSQDVNLSVVNEFSRPLEGLLDNIPHTIDIAARAKGHGIRNNRFSSMKYWVNTEPMELDFQFTFETQVDSYYDVYQPVVDLLTLALPGLKDGGFLVSPTPTIKFIAEEFISLAGEFVDSEGNLRLTADNDTVGGKAVTFLGQAVKEMRKIITDLGASIQDSGFSTSLRIGNNFNFKPILIKSITPTFSTETAYAPLRFINQILNKGVPFHLQQDFITPARLGEYTAKLFSQTICSTIAMANNASSEVLGFIKAMPPFIRNAIFNSDGSAKFSVIPSYPIKAEVNMSVELQYPTTKTLRDARTETTIAKTDIRKLFLIDSTSDIGM